MSSEEEWMDLCERAFVEAIKSGVTGKDLDDYEEEYEEARRMYKISREEPSQNRKYK